MNNFLNITFALSALFTVLTGCNRQNETTLHTREPAERQYLPPAGSKYKLEPKLHLNEESGLIEYGIQLGDDKRESLQDTVEKPAVKAPHESTELSKISP